MTRSHSLRRSVVLAAAFAAIAAVASAQAPGPEGASGRSPKPPVVSKRFMVAAAQSTRRGRGLRDPAARRKRRRRRRRRAARAGSRRAAELGSRRRGIHAGSRCETRQAHRVRRTRDGARRGKPDRFLDNEGKPLQFYDAVIGGRSVGVPGVVALLAETPPASWQAPLGNLFVPAIELAENGFQVSARLHALVAAEERLEQPRARAYFYDFLGNPLPAGRLDQESGVRRDAAQDRRGGAEAFYEGEIARDIVDHRDRRPQNPGDMTLADLANYRVKVREPVCGTLSGVTAFAECRCRPRAD